MKRLIVFTILFLSLGTQAQFKKYFHDKALRVNYEHSGDFETEFFYLTNLMEEQYWGGSHTKLIDTLEYGDHFFKVFDKKSGKLIYSHGFCSLFHEWQSVAEAKSLHKSFREAIIMPFPKEDVNVVFYSRDAMGKWDSKFEFTIDVDSYFILPTQKHQFPVYDAFISGDSKDKVDIVILPEGYTKEELEDFKKDCNTFAEFLFRFEPFASYKDHFNIRGVLAPSEESGSDIPAKHIYKNTLLDSKFYTFDSERYCMVEDFQNVRDIAANAPYDQIYILVNTEKYGGGGIYNFYNVSAIRNEESAKVVVHEFGHGFAGLADEYYDNSTSYEGLFNKQVEPWQPNLTTLVDFDSKWKHLMNADTPIPTEANAANSNILGVYEGGGYEAKGVYRPKMDCLMHTFKDGIFCEACKEGIVKMIKFHSSGE